MIRKILFWILKAMAVFFAVTFFWALLYRWVNPPITWLHISDQIFQEESSTYHYEWVDGEEISRYMKLAVVSSEDNNFMTHNGFDWEAIEKARKYNETHKKKRGASTISQQTAKNVFLWPSRSWIRKGLEVYFTFLAVAGYRCTFKTWTRIRYPNTDPDPASRVNTDLDPQLSAPSIPVLLVRTLLPADGNEEHVLSDGRRGTRHFAIYLMKLSIFSL